MKVAVCVKIVSGALNPFDESALECALQLSRDVTVLSMGPRTAESVLQPLTRLGARVVLLSDPCFAGSDTLATAYVLSRAMESIKPDIILCGRQSIDGDTAQVGPMVSAMLDIPLITNALSVQVTDNTVTAQTRLGTDSFALPALVTVERSYRLRFPSIFSSVHDVEVRTNADLLCDEEKCGYKGSPTRVMETFENESGKRHCRFITMEELIPLIHSLQSKAYAPNKTTVSQQKLSCAWAVGDEVLEKARDIADEVVVFPKGDVRGLVEKSKQEHPPVILFNADLWGRKHAPLAAAMLQTGLCADCTALEVADDMLYMYRPARSGNIYAKIKCLTRPQMATVRTQSDSRDIIVAGGRGVHGNTEALYRLAKSLGAEVAASRGLVDLGDLPYDAQVGLTGKTVSPQIYIAVGISGAVHHTCAIETAGTIIAINPDKDARIFSYADYGIVDSFA